MITRAWVDILLEIIDDGGPRSTRGALLLLREYWYERAGEWPEDLELRFFSMVKKKKWQSPVEWDLYDALGMQYARAGGKTRTAKDIYDSTPIPTVTFGVDQDGRCDMNVFRIPTIHEKKLLRWAVTDERIQRLEHGGTWVMWEGFDLCSRCAIELEKPTDDETHNHRDDTKPNDSNRIT